MLTIALSLSGCGRKKETQEPQQPPTPSETDSTTVIVPSEPLHPDVLDQNPTYREEFDDAVVNPQETERYLILVNKEVELAGDYVPANLVDIPSEYRVDKPLRMVEGALAALQLMMSEMRADGITDALVTSAYRSYEYQAQIYNDYLIKELEGISPEAYACLGHYYITVNYIQKGLDSLTMQDARRVVDSYSARPGNSEHQSGLCVDFIEISKSGLDVSFEHSQSFEWLSQNAYRFGFILRYPQGKEDITGYTYEPWHYRFVGREAATEIYAWGYTLEEYLTLKAAQ